jgi:DNA-binding CsgD family transcriptional regulator
MTPTKELSALLATLYAAPLEPEKWQAFFDHLCALTSISSGYLIASHPDEGNLCLAGGGLNFDPEVFRLYNEHYGANDPYRAPLMENPRVGLIQGEDLVTHATLRESELYNEVLSRFDLEHMNILSCNCSMDQAELLSLWRSTKYGPMDSASIHLLDMLIPHVQTALRLRTKIAACNASDLFSETTLDAMSIAAFLVTGKGRVRHMNQRAAAYLQSGDGLLLAGGRLAAESSNESAQLESLIAGATSSGRNSLEAVPGGAIRISRSCIHSTLQVTVLPAPENNQIIDGDSCALVFVSDPSSPPRPRTTLIRQLYGLTPAESRLADLLMEGLEVRDVAERLRMTVGTARFHLKRVLEKTGTHRQTELMRLMLSLPGQGERQ